ncbi:MAG: YbaB/EbfC family nucleoid-associated protein [Clostridia bacterium]|nr:YbaB/EbfC family nucleoid-associated protein [Clostridia bacterium]
MAGYRGGFGGGFGGGAQMQQLMKQAQKMQEQMAKAQEELEDAQLVGVSGNGLVKVTVNGKKVVSGIELDKSIVDPDDVEMLEDLIVAALSDAYGKAEKLYAEKMGQFGGGMGLF